MNPNDSNWTTVEPIKSDFNMEAILRADPRLLQLWKAHPFTFELDDNCKIITRYMVFSEGK